MPVISLRFNSVNFFKISSAGWSFVMLMPIESDLSLIETSQLLYSFHPVKSFFSIACIGWDVSNRFVANFRNNKDHRLIPPSG